MRLNTHILIFLLPITVLSYIFCQAYFNPVITHYLLFSIILLLILTSLILLYRLIHRIQASHFMTKIESGALGL